MNNHTKERKEAVRTAYSNLETWANVGKLYGVNPTTVCRFATTNYEPKDNQIRAKLGLAPICPNCGHIVDIG